MTMIRLAKTPRAVQRAFPRLTWSLPTAIDSVFLTFDDGPTPGVTERVLDSLKQYNAKATFFCVGRNVMNYPRLFERILHEGHAVGNHTFNHVNGWETPAGRYLKDVEYCNRIFYSRLFRPPYGKVRPAVRKEILKNYHVVMWDVLSYDFDESLTAEDCYAKVERNMVGGSIVVFHDSKKAADRVLGALPKVLERCHARGWNCKALPSNMRV